MPTGNAMKRLEEGTVYKCLGISEDEINISRWKMKPPESISDK